MVVLSIYLIIHLTGKFNNKDISPYTNLNIKYLALFPGPAQLFFASTKKWERAWYLFSHE